MLGTLKFFSQRFIHAALIFISFDNSFWVSFLLSLNSFNLSENLFIILQSKYIPNGSKILDFYQMVKYNIFIPTGKRSKNEKTYQNGIDWKLFERKEPKQIPIL